MVHRLPFVLVAMICAGPLSSCTLFFAATELTAPSVHSGDTRQAVRARLGTPLSSVEFRPPRRMGQVPVLRTRPQMVPEGLRDRLVGAEDQFRIRGTSRHAAGDFTQLDAAVFYSMCTFGLLEPVMAPKAAAIAIQSHLTFHRLYVWYDPDGVCIESWWIDPEKPSTGEDGKPR